MKHLPVLLWAFVLFGCSEKGLEGLEPTPALPIGPQIVVTDVYGRQYPDLDPSVIYCGPGWGAKMCHFLHKYDGTIWADPDNYYSDYSDVKFSNFWDPFFISFFEVDSVASHCNGWKLDEMTYNGVKWTIEIVKDQEDVLWFDYNYYGTNTEIEYTTLYKYEVIDGLLNFSSSDGRSFTFHPSERDYSEDLIDTDEIVEQQGCLF